MIEQSVSLASNGVVKVPGYEQLVRFGYTKNRGVYRLHVDATGEWEGLAIRCFWHVPGGSDPPSSLVVDGYVAVPSSVTAQPGSGCVTFEGSDGTKTVTSADLRYRVSANSGTEDGTMPEPDSPAWQQLVDAVHTDATAAEQAKTDARTAASEAATSAGNADQSAQEAAGSLQELKDGIASGNFKGEPGTSPTVTVQDIAGGHRIVITDATGTSSVDVMDGKQGDPGKPGDTGATPELTIGTVEEGDAPSATITGTAKNPVLNLTLKSGAPGKDATVDATLSQSGKAADAKVTGDALATKAVIDDTTVGTDAWSSKHIVDMLCPPLEETGNPVTCYPVAGYPLGCKVSWEPTQEGSGEPSPENIRPIKGRDSVTVEVTGANVLEGTAPGGRFNSMGVTYTVNESGVLVTGTATGGSSLYLHSDSKLRLTRGVYYLTTKGLSTSIVLNFFYVGKFTSDLQNQQVTLTKDVEYSLVLQPKIGATVNTTVQVSLTRNKTTTYSPYNGQTATLTLPRTIYGGTVDAVTGEGKENAKIITLDGNELKFAKANIYINLPAHSAPGISKGEIICCSHFNRRLFAVNTTYEFCFLLESDMTSLFASVDDLNAYLAAQYAAETPVQIAYKLAEPVPFTATGAQPIPALSGVNTLLTDADKLAVTGRADPIKRITDLEDAVASMT